MYTLTTHTKTTHTNNTHRQHIHTDNMYALTTHTHTDNTHGQHIHIDHIYTWKTHTHRQHVHMGNTHTLTTRTDNTLTPAEPREKQTPCPVHLTMGKRLPLKTGQGRGDSTAIAVPVLQARGTYLHPQRKKARYGDESLPPECRELKMNRSLRFIGQPVSLTHSVSSRPVKDPFQK